MQSSKKKRIYHILIVLISVGFLFGLIYFVLQVSGWWEKLNSVSKLQQTILSLGFWGRFAFVTLQFLQVTFIPLPSPVIVGAGSLIYGPFQASLLSLAGILLGSAFAFFLGKMFGRKLVTFMVGEALCNKWQKFLNRCKYTFVLTMLLPLFPDDVLCLVAGQTDMSWNFFIATQFVTRPIGIFLVSYFFSGEIIPYHGWGLIVWGIILAASVVLIYFSSKYSDKIEGMIKRIFSKKAD
ncbi:MAG: TVP38/TMEM64 family protein [Clostridia bacterium]|nr:TVP38/TMEM64 family protein [Clostridia bacterium]